MYNSGPEGLNRKENIWTLGAPNFLFVFVFLNVKKMSLFRFLFNKYCETFWNPNIHMKNSQLKYTDLDL